MKTRAIRAGTGAAIARWSPRRPLAALWSAGGAGWRTILAEPRGTYRYRADGRSEWIGLEGARAADGPLGTVRRLLAGRGTSPASGWVGFFSYDLGRVLEPAASGPRQEEGRDWPLIELHRCEGGRRPRSGDAPARRCTIGDLRSATGRERFEDSVSAAIEYIRAGDVFQVNLAHRLSAPFAGSTRRLFLELARRARPRYGAYLETSDGDGGRRRAIVSMSPELFLEFDAGSRRVITRPMKGTRPGSADPRDLEDSPKDRAELDMIIDLMRNDLGRVCRFGTVRVETPRTIEPHGVSPAHLLTCSPAQASPALWQATGTVTGELREGLDICDLLGATFPPGSVTGAPKIRAMQIIDELEPVARGPYCGCIGWIGDDGSAAFSVAIRTAVVTGTPPTPAPDGALDRIEDGVLDYSVGAGIVADSDPASEWRETLDKAAVLGALG